MDRLPSSAQRPVRGDYEFAITENLFSTIMLRLGRYLVLGGDLWTGIEIRRACPLCAGAQRIAPRRAFGHQLRNDYRDLGPIDHIGDLLIGTRYNNKGALDITTFHLPPVEGAPFAVEKGAVVIDARISGPPDFKDHSSRVGSVSATPRGGIGPMYAVDGDPVTFWEVFHQPFPINSRSRSLLRTGLPVTVSLRSKNR